MLKFWKSDRGQDLSEWCLLTALVSRIALAIFYHFSGGIAEPVGYRKHYPGHRRLRLQHGAGQRAGYTDDGQHAVAIGA